MGDEVFISYGILTNPDLLNTYGFIMLDNPFETVGFKLSLGDVAPSQSMASAETNDETHDDPMPKIRLQMYSKRTRLWQEKTEIKDDVSDGGSGGRMELATHISLDGRPSSSFTEGLRISELRWCDLADCASKHGKDNLHPWEERETFSPPPPPLRPPLRPPSPPPPPPSKVFLVLLSSK